MAQIEAQRFSAHNPFHDAKRYRDKNKTLCGEMTSTGEPCKGYAQLDIFSKKIYPCHKHWRN